MRETLIVVCGVILFSAVSVFAQDNSKAVLSALTKEVDSYSSLYVEYNMLTENKQLNTSKRDAGKLTASKNRFKLTTGNLEVYCDGETQWSYIKDANEVTISLADPDGDDIFSNPVKFITGQRKDFKYKYKGEVEVDGKVLTEIDYYPKDLQAPYSIIRMHLDQKKMQPHSIKYFGKDGVLFTLNLVQYKPNIPVTTTEFTFNPSGIPEIEIVDLR